MDQEGALDGLLDVTIRLREGRCAMPAARVVRATRPRGARRRGRARPAAGGRGRDPRASSARARRRRRSLRRAAFTTDSSG